MQIPFFPFLVPCNHEGYSSQAFREVFHSVRKDRIWFAYDVVVESPTQVEFIVYDMNDPVRGGVGREIFRESATVLPLLTEDAMKTRARHLARLKREKELDDAEDAIVASYAKAFLADAQRNTP